MNHLTDDDLVLHYYGEDGSRLVAAARHLRSCAQCARAFASLSQTLSAVTPPEIVEAPDDLHELRALLRDASRHAVPRGAIALVWAAAFLYPFSFQALYGSARVAQDYPAGTLLVLFTLAWACAGPFVATVALNRLPAAGVRRASSRLLVLGALMATISPAVYLLVSRADTRSLNLGVASWFGALALSSALAAFRWPSVSHSTARFQFLHRLSAILLTVFVLGHIVNQALAFISVPMYDAMRSVMRVASRDPVMYTVIVASVLMQMATGAAMGIRRVRNGAVARNLQAVTGWYLAAFLLTHVFSGYLFSPPPQVTTAVAPAASQFDMLGSVRAASQLPYLLLGVAAFLFHVGIYARLAALAYFAEASVRRLSYAAMFVGTTVVVTVGLALCGIHLIR